MLILRRDLRVFGEMEVLAVVVVRVEWLEEAVDLIEKVEGLAVRFRVLSGATDLDLIGGEGDGFSES
ncbi:hypothetical protein ACFX13_040776 [Malus domestica]